MRQGFGTGPRQQRQRTVRIPVRLRPELVRRSGSREEVHERKLRDFVLHFRKRGEVLLRRYDGNRRESVLLRRTRVLFRQGIGTPTADRLLRTRALPHIASGRDGIRSVAQQSEDLRRFRKSHVAEYRQQGEILRVLPEHRELPLHLNVFVHYGDAQKTERIPRRSRG